MDLIRFRNQAFPPSESPHFYFIFLPTGFSKRHHIYKENHQFSEIDYAWIFGKVYQASHLHDKSSSHTRHLVAAAIWQQRSIRYHSREYTHALNFIIVLFVKCIIILDRRPNSYASIKFRCFSSDYPHSS